MYFILDDSSYIAIVKNGSDEYLGKIDVDSKGGKPAKVLVPSLKRNTVSK